MQDSSEPANAAFLTKAERNELYLFLLHDFQKAYDFLSLSHSLGAACSS